MAYPIAPRVQPVPFETLGEWPSAPPPRPAPPPPIDPARFAPPPAPAPRALVLAEDGLAEDDLAPSLSSRLLAELAAGPFGLYKRLAVYPPLAMVVFDTMTCRGLSLGAHVALGVIMLVGLAGVAARLSVRRG
jgi:hypothetical protein